MGPRRGHDLVSPICPTPANDSPLPDSCHVAHARPCLPCQRGPPPRPGGRDAGAPPDDDRAGVSQAGTAVLTYFRDGADLVVIGSFGGSDLPPAWWLNLQRDPQASVLIGGTTSTVTARAATAEEHDRLWPLVATTHPGYARYQERTARLIPIVMLTPEDAEPRRS